MPQFTAVAVLWLLIENRFLNGPTTVRAQSTTCETTSFDGLASNTISRIPATISRNTATAASRTIRATVISPDPAAPAARSPAVGPAGPRPQRRLIAIAIESDLPVRVAFTERPTPAARAES